VLIVGDDGPARRGLIHNSMYDSMGSEYMSTIGAMLHTCCREVDGIGIKLVAWQISTNPSFKQLRSAYYRDASLILLTAESTSQEAFERYLDILSEIKDIQGRLLVSIISEDRNDIDSQRLAQFAKEIDASQLVLDPSNKQDLQRSIDRFLREHLLFYLAGESYLFSFLRSHGLAKNALSLIRNEDDPEATARIFDIDSVDSYLAEGGSSLFLDVELLSETRLARYVQKIIDSRQEEMRKTWVNLHDGVYDLRYLWLTAYGFEICRALSLTLTTDEEGFVRLKEACDNLGFDLQVKEDDLYPESNLDDETKRYVWDFVEKMANIRSLRQGH
jgi:hypothetical protein